MVGWVKYRWTSFMDVLCSFFLVVTLQTNYFLTHTQMQINFDFKILKACYQREIWLKKTYNRAKRMKKEVCYLISKWIYVTLHYLTRSWTSWILDTSAILTSLKDKQKTIITLKLSNKAWLNFYSKSSNTCWRK